MGRQDLTISSQALHSISSGLTNLQGLRVFQTETDTAINCQYLLIAALSQLREPYLKGDVSTQRVAGTSSADGLLHAVGSLKQLALLKLECVNLSGCPVQAYSA